MARRLTPEQKDRRREQSRLRMAAKRSAQTSEQLEAERAYHREHDRKRRQSPARREYHNQLRRRIRAATKFDKTFTMPKAMICCNPNCSKLAIHDSLGQTGLCPDHTVGAHSILNRDRPHGVQANA